MTWGLLQGRQPNEKHYQDTIGAEKEGMPSKTNAQLELQLTEPPLAPYPTRSRVHHVVKSAALVFLALLVSTLLKLGFNSEGFAWHRSTTSHEELCPQESPLVPNSDLLEALEKIYAQENFGEQAAEALGGAVRVPTEVFDDLGPVGQDPRWNVFQEFHRYLEATFPNIHKTLTLTKVNTYGLLYEWEGTNSSLAPILLMAHQDVVPVDHGVYSQWKYPPFSGKHVDGWVWGRGSQDDKSGLIASLLAVETLLQVGFVPRRNIVLSFGFDEEASGNEGAASLATYLKARNAPQFAMILDEGAGYAESFGGVFALPVIAEKGATNVEVQVKTAGGHSSTPPKHTSIGYLSLLIAALEDHSDTPTLRRESPFFNTVKCTAAHGPNTTVQYRNLVRRASDGDDKALRAVERFLLSREGPKGDQIRAMLRTTQAIDVISGGVKVNALPEEAHAIINYRIAVETSLRELEDSILAVVRPVAEKYGLDVFDFEGKSLSNTSTAGTVILSEAFEGALPSSPVSPPDSNAFKLLSGTIKAAYKADNPTKGPIVVAPGMMNGNTDTRYYWDLSENIFRYNHLGPWHSMNGVHTINEAVRVDGFVSNVKFFTYLILNADESTSL